MRISDWSSDVCSSDLRVARQRCPDCREIPRYPPRPRLSRLPRAQRKAHAVLIARRRGKRRHGTHGRLRDAADRGGFRVLLQPPEEPVLRRRRSEEHTSELQSLMRISYAVFCLKNKRILNTSIYTIISQTNHKYKTHSSTTLH